MLGSDTPDAKHATRKVVVHKAGGHDRLTIERGPTPVPAAGQVLIEVEAIGVNFADTIVRMGLYASAKEYVGWPITPGFEVAGVVSSVGAGVDDVAVGSEVFAVTLFGGYSTHVAVDRRYVFPKAPGIGFAEAAAMPAVFLTAWYALFELAHPRRGQLVLVHSAAGGVGGALVQLARNAGCRVVGVVGASHKVDTVKAHGADHVIDKSTQDLWREARRLGPDGYDVVLDANGVSTLKQSYHHLRRSGKLVVYGFHSMMPKAGGRPNWPKLAADYLRTPRFNPLTMTNDSKSVLAFNLSYLFDRVDILHMALAEIAGWLATGAITAPPVTTYPLDDVARAHADLESGRTVG
ncbi:MAG TPA: medium chain dehydrogenase/reductase family protein, partial [Kofleriaceae bacterium]|nr:medium chain dehydrogenase/reductase family protein [Kofleriaceae bacterium]